MNELRFVPADDEIKFRVTAQRVLRRRTVLVTVPIELLVGPDETDAAPLEQKVKEALARFIDAEWVTSSASRYGGAAGYERLTMSASTRIPVEQAFNLAERARSAGVKGLSIGEPMLEYRVPRSVVNTVSAELRKEVVEQVKRHIAEFDEWTGRAWRIGSIELGAGGGSGQRTAKGMYRSEDDLDEGDSDDDRLAGLERLQIVAAVTLRSRV